MAAKKRPRRAQGTGTVHEVGGWFYPMLPAVYGKQRRVPDVDACDTYEKAARALDRYLRDHPPGSKARKRAPSADRSVTMYLNQYLDTLADGGRTQAVSLGRVEGFPVWTTDPDVIDAAVKARLAGLNGATPTVKLRAIQRAQELRAAADRLRAGGDSDLHQFFLDNAAAWGERHGIGWGAWRELGVPAKILKEAGITR